MVVKNGIYVKLRFPNHHHEEYNALKSITFEVLDADSAKEKRKLEEHFTVVRAAQKKPWKLSPCSVQNSPEKMKHSFLSKNNAPLKCSRTMSSGQRISKSSRFEFLF